MKFRKEYAGYYKTIYKNVEYSIRKNEITKEWHIYVNDEWSRQIDSYKAGKNFLKETIR